MIGCRVAVTFHRPRSAGIERGCAFEKNTGHPAARAAFSTTRMACTVAGAEGLLKG